MKWLIFFLMPICFFGSPLEELFQIFEIPQEEKLEAIAEKWMQQGKERWFFEKRYEEMRERVWPLFQEIGMIDEMAPLKDHYDTVVVTGALLATVQRRIGFLIQTGVSYDRLVFLTGERPLLESEKEMLPGLETEYDMFQWVYEHSEISKEIPVIWVNAPRQGDRRPNSYDTILKWLEIGVENQNYLLVSSQPYVHYQGAIFARFFPYPIDLAGPAVVGSPTVALMLDTLGREIFYKEGDIEWLQK